MSMFKAIWPVIESEKATDAELIAGAIGDLPAVAARHRAAITGTPEARILPGRLVPGSNGAHRVVVVTAEAHQTPRRRK